MAETVSPEFVAEAQEIVDALNSGVIAAEAQVRIGAEISPDQVNELFRHAHSLKGISGMFGLEQITRLAHALEGVLDGMRLGKVRIDAAALDVLFACVETFGQLIAAVSKGQEIDVTPREEPAKVVDLMAALESSLQEHKKRKKAS